MQIWMRYDVIVVGGGMAGMTAAMYARRAGKRTLVLEAQAYGGQILPAGEVENYPGVPGATGAGLSQALEEQLDGLGAERKHARVTGVQTEAGGFLVRTDGANDFHAARVSLAVGVRRRRLEIPGEERLTGRGVSWCATCDGNFFRGRQVAVAGGGNTAVQEALHLSVICERVWLIHRRDTLRADAWLTERMRQAGNIVFVPGVVIREVLGDAAVEGLLLAPANSAAHESGNPSADFTTACESCNPSADSPLREFGNPFADSGRAARFPAPASAPARQPETGRIPHAVTGGKCTSAEPEAHTTSANSGSPSPAGGPARAAEASGPLAVTAPPGLRVSALFEAVGMLPQNQPFADLVPLDKNGYFLVGEDCRTPVPGLFVAGDCRAKAVRQLVSAAADGAAAAMAATED